MTQDSTLEGLTDRPSGRRSHRLAVTGLVLLVLAGVLGLLGPRTGQVEDTTGPWDLRVTYPSVTRAGVPTPLHLTVTREAGFEGVEAVRVALCDDWFDHVDFQSWYPTPAAETGLPGRLVYDFDPPPTGRTLEVSLDAHEQPGGLAGRRTCEVEVLLDDVVAASVSFSTWRLP
ncbi:hypothetical protein [Nocardioides solisilvae]|uniref:hypothetical protein n=1 Tax=Nocardioides solisilvae TaxID=1542435 RepID=UPI000D746A7A|nr:hypothetical protein [Nocardioides solisilvae]